MKRDYYLDFLRGLAALNIIIIHTAFWSGEAYVPSYFQSITLLLDVPFFFFLSGWSFSYIKSSFKVFKGLFELQKKYMFFLLIYTLILFIFTSKDISLLNFIYNFFYVNTIESNLLPVVMGSIWFMPVYFAVSFIFPVMIEFIIKSKSKNSIFILLSICLFGFIYTQLGYNFFYLSRQILFYGFFYVLGFISRNYRIYKFGSFCIIVLFNLFLIILFKNIFDIDSIVVQNLKFPPHIIYLLISMFSVYIALYYKGKISISDDNLIAKIGNHAVFYYFSQGISSSLIIFLVNKVNHQWYIKFLICSFVNIVLTILIAELLNLIYIKLMSYISFFIKSYGEKLKLFYLMEEN